MQGVGKLIARETILQELDSFNFRFFYPIAYIKDFKMSGVATAATMSNVFRKIDLHTHILPPNCPGSIFEKLLLFAHI